MNPDRDFLLDIIEFIETIERHRPEAFEDFIEDEVVRTATIHWVQTIGEAATGMSEDFRSMHPDVPWREIVDMRNLLAHGYRYVDPAIVWEGRDSRPSKGLKLRFGKSSMAWKSHRDRLSESGFF